MMTRLFRNRAEAGQILATELTSYAKKPDVLVLGLPRGGIPVAYEVARSLDAPLDVFVVRKLGVPGYEELAMGAIASGGVIAFDPAFAELIHGSQIDAVIERETAELSRRERIYRNHRPARDPGDKIVILVDDGLATGASMQAAVRALRELQPKRIIVAVPVASHESCASLRGVADDLVCAQTPEAFYAVGQWYQDFTQVGDDEVRALLQRAAEEYARNHTTSPRGAA